MDATLTLLAVPLMIAGSLAALLGEIWLLAVLLRRGRVWAVASIVLPQFLLIFIAAHPRLSARPLLLVAAGLALLGFGRWLLPLPPLP